MADAPRHWVFGYGSLMWRPGFESLRAEPARLKGYHRSLCVYSHKYRGSHAAPGLVFGLDRGGSCTGLAFEVAPDRWEQTIAYLREREQVTMVYREMALPVTLLSGEKIAAAVTYVVDRAHAQYAGGLNEHQIIALVHQGQGEAGSCVDYVKNTLSHLRLMGFRDHRLERLASHL